MPAPLTFNEFELKNWISDIEVASKAAQIASSVVGGLVANLGNLVFGGFSEVTGLDVQLDIEAYQEGGNNYSPLHFRKPAKYSSLVLKRGATPRTDLWDWHQQVLAGNAPVIRKSGLIIMFDRGRGPISGNADVDGWMRAPLGAWYV